MEKAVGKDLRSCSGLSLLLSRGGLCTLPGQNLGGTGMLTTDLCDGAVAIITTSGAMEAVAMVMTAGMIHRHLTRARTTTMLHDGATNAPAVREQTIVGNSREAGGATVSWAARLAQPPDTISAVVVGTTTEVTREEEWAGRTMEARGAVEAQGLRGQAPQAADPLQVAHDTKALVLVLPTVVEAFGRIMSINSTQVG